MAQPDLYGMPETDASRLQGDNDVLRADNERLRAAGTEIVRLAKSLDVSDEEWDQAIDALVEALN